MYRKQVRMLFRIIDYSMIFYEVYILFHIILIKFNNNLTTGRPLTLTEYVLKSTIEDSRESERNRKFWLNNYKLSWIVESLNYTDLKYYYNKIHFL